MPIFASTKALRPPLPFGLPGGFRLLRRAFRGQPLGVQIHVLGRYLTCPFLRFLPHLPEKGRLLDIGAGHGALGLLAAAARGVRTVGVEPDLRKVLPAPRGAGSALVVGTSGTIAGARGGAGAFDAVSIVDVLYRIPLDGWDAILDDARRCLRPGGLLLLKEIDPEDRLKGGWNRFQEKVADLLGMTLGDAFSYETRTQITSRLSRLGFEAIEVHPIDAGYPHAHVLYLARRAAG